MCVCVMMSFPSYRPVSFSSTCSMIPACKIVDVVCVSVPVCMCASVCVCVCLVCACVCVGVLVCVRVRDSYRGGGKTWDIPPKIHSVLTLFGIFLGEHVPRPPT